MGEMRISGDSTLIWAEINRLSTKGQLSQLSSTDLKIVSTALKLLIREENLSAEMKLKLGEIFAKVASDQDKTILKKMIKTVDELVGNKGFILREISSDLQAINKAQLQNIHENPMGLSSGPAKKPDVPLEPAEVMIRDRKSDEIPVVFVKKLRQLNPNLSTQSSTEALKKFDKLIEEYSLFKEGKKEALGALLRGFREVQYALQPFAVIPEIAPKYSQVLKARAELLKFMVANDPSRATDGVTNNIAALSEKAKIWDSYAAFSKPKESL